MGFRKSYINARTGREIRDPVLIAKKYLKFYFWVDAYAAIPFDYFMENRGGQYKLFSLVKILRFLRLQKIVSYLNVTNMTRVKIRLVYHILILLIILHWLTCAFHVVIEQGTHAILNDTDSQDIVSHNQDGTFDIKFDYNYWIPPVDLGNQKTNFYDLPAS